VADRSELAEPLSAWLEVPRAIEEATGGLTDADLDLRGGSDGWTIRETVHHLVEANVVAGSIVIAALGKSGCTYDWSWLNPDRSWMERMGYDCRADPSATPADRELQRRSAHAPLRRT
jgi:hypothetical protein